MAFFPSEKKNKINQTNLYTIFLYLNTFTVHTRIKRTRKKKDTSFYYFQKSKKHLVIFTLKR